MRVRIRLRHVVHSLVVLAVLTQLVFAGLFLADVLRTSATYDGLVAHRVPVTGHLVECFNFTGAHEELSTTTAMPRTSSGIKSSMPGSTRAGDLSST